MNNKLKVGLLLLVVAFVSISGVSAYSGRPGWYDPNGGGLHTTSNPTPQACTGCHNGGGAPLCTTCHSNPFTLTVVANPTTVTAGTPASVTFTVTRKNSAQAVGTATVDLSGAATGSGTTSSAGTVDINVNAGSAGTITATAAKTGYTSGTTSITATSSVQTAVLKNITVMPETANIPIGKTQKFTAAAKDQNGNPMSVVISWTSSNETVGTIDASGNFSALAAGTTTIKAENGTVNGTASVTVTEATQTPVLTTIKVVPPTAKIIVGKNRSFMAKAFDQFNNTISALVTWTSSNTSVGTIDNNGNFTALSAGKTTITATNGTINGSATITVKAKLSRHIDDDSKEDKKDREDKKDKEDTEDKEDEHELEED